MPILGGLVLLLALACAIHAGRTGRPSYWIYIVLILPGLGVLAYVLFELVPEWLGSAAGQRTAQRLSRFADPEKAFRALRDEAEIAPTVENMMRLAEECLRLDRFDEAAALYERCLHGMHASEPHLMLGLARAQFGAGQPGAARTTLDRLRVANPEFQSTDGHLLYARSLEALGDAAAARAEYEALVGYFPGPEATCRYALLLERTGEADKARAIFAEIKRRIERSPRHVRQMHAEWYQLAVRRAGT